MSGVKTIANQPPRLLGVQVTTCLYNTAIPLIIGTRRTSGRVIWYGYFQNAASGKKGKGSKKGLVAYAANLDVLLGFGPLFALQAAWNNSSIVGYGLDPVSHQLINKYSQMKSQTYAVLSGDYAANPDGTYTYSNTVSTVTGGWNCDFISAISITPTTPNSTSIDDYGDPLSPRMLTETATEQWLYNTYDNYSGSGAGAVAWRPGSWALGKPLCNNGHCAFPIGVDHGDLGWSITLPAPTPGTITVYFGETENNHRYPASYVNYEFEPVLGSGNEYNGSLSSQQILYPELTGVAGLKIDLGSTGAAPQIDVEAQGLYSLDRNGQANPADFILDVILSGNIYFTDPSSGAFTPLCFSHGLNFGGDPTRANLANIISGNKYPGTYAWPPQVVFPYVIPGYGLYQILKDPPVFFYGAYTPGTAYPASAIVSKSGVYYQYLGGEPGVASAPPSSSWITFTGSFSDGLTDVRNYCQANGIFMSAAVQDQSDASSLLEDVCKIANCMAVWNGQTLDFYPLSEASAIGGGYLYTPRANSQLLIPNFDLRHFVVDGTEAPVTVKQTSLQSVYNILDVNYADRGSDSLGACGYASYQSNSVRICDVQHSQAYGPMNGSPLGFDNYLTDATSATLVGWPIMKRQRYEDPYLIEFKLPKTLATLLDPMDLLVIEEPTLFGGPQPGGGPSFSGNSQQPVRIRQIEEDSSGVWTLTCERYIYGASVPSNPSVATATPNPNSALNTDAGPVNAPYFFEPTNALATALGMATTNGLGIALSNSSTNYGGCQVYVSTDGGSSYQLLGALSGNSVMGAVTADYPSAPSPDTTDSLYVDLTESDGALQSWTTAQQDQLVPIALLDNSATPSSASTGGYTLTVPYEVISYGTVTLTATSKYTLSPSILRGQLGTVPADHPAPTSVPPSQFVDFSNPASVFKTVIPSGKILNNTLYFKFASFNNYRTALQDITECTAYTYTLTGQTNPGAFTQYTVSPSPCLTQGNQAAISNNDATRVYFPNLTVNYATGPVSYTASSAVAFSNSAGGETKYISIYDPGQVGGAPTIDVQSTNIHATTPGYVFLGQITSIAWTGSPGSGTGGASGGLPAGSSGTGGPQDPGIFGYVITVNGVPIK